MAASMKAYISTGATESTARASAETGIKFNRVDSQSGTTPIPIPTATGTNYSYYKSLYLYCDSATGAGTSISDKKIHLSGSPDTGLAVVYKDVTDTYTQATAVLASDASGGSPPATPATYTAATTRTVPSTGDCYQHHPQHGRTQQHQHAHGPHQCQPDGAGVVDRRGAVAGTDGHGAQSVNYRHRAQHQPDGDGA